MSHRKLILGAFLACLMSTASVQAQEETCIDFEVEPGPDDQLGTADDIPLIELTSMRFSIATGIFLLLSVGRAAAQAPGGLVFVE